MQRISFKRVVFLALLVMSISLVPSTIVHSAPEDPIIVQPDAGDNPDNAEAKDGQEESASGAGFEAPETLESLRHDLDQLKAELRQQQRRRPVWYQPGDHPCRSALLARLFRSCCPGFFSVARQRLQTNQASP